MDERDGFIRRGWCVWLGVGLVVLGGLMNALYLWNHCPIQLSEDESHYWEWSRHLDYGYYSKPPGIALVIWAAVRVGGVLGVGDGSWAPMAMIRMPAVLFGMLSGLLSLFLARRIFRDDRAGLAAIVLSGAVPMFAVGSLLITIDSPMYLCWGAGVFCLWRAVERSQEPEARSQKVGGGGWILLAGVCCGLGMLFKPVLVAVPLCVLVGMYFDLGMRRVFWRWESLAGLGILLLSQVPVVLWNWRHEWVTFRHIGAQAGVTGTSEGWNWLGPIARVGEYVGGQAGGMGGGMFVLLVIAVVVGSSRVRGIPQVSASDQGGTVTPGKPGAIWARTRWVFLLSFALPLWGFYLLLALWKGTEPNWPAASYFAGMILLAGVFVEGWNSAVAKVRRSWRVGGIVVLAAGFIMTWFAMNVHRVYPMIARKLEPMLWTPAYQKSPWHPKRWDPSMKLRGKSERAAIVEQARQELRKETGQEPLVVTDRYDRSSSLAYYLPDRPFVYSVMSNVGGRRSQYDIWPGLERGKAEAGLMGRPAVVVRFMDEDAMEKLLSESFERWSGPVILPVMYEGVMLETLVIYKGYGLKGVPAGLGKGGAGGGAW